MLRGQEASSWRALHTCWLAGALQLGYLLHTSLAGSAGDRVISRGREGLCHHTLALLALKGWHHLGSAPRNPGVSVHLQQVSSKGHCSGPMEGASPWSKVQSHCTWGGCCRFSLYDWGISFFKCVSPHRGPNSVRPNADARAGLDIRAN